jgi:glycosyltransferase involved in cell wall biosynthesis
MNESIVRPTLCVGILTLNEENRITTCIRSAHFADQILVIDSGSKDKTQELAKEAGAEVHDYPDWQGFAEQRNRMLRHCQCDFIFFLDADEQITPPLEQEILQAMHTPDDVIWQVMWDQVAYGRTLSRMKSTGGVQRMFRTASLLRFEGVVHEKAIMRTSDLPVRRFKSRLLHHSRETIYGSILKLAQYAQLGAAKRAKAGKTGGVLRGFASGFASFFQLYILRRGFLCGAEGSLFCFFVSLEAFLRYAMLRYDRDHLSNIVKR